MKPYWCRACHTRSAQPRSPYCLRCDAMWTNATPANDLCVHCHDAKVEPGDVYCWWCNEELMSVAFGDTAPPCND